jgi:hypothetical protein
VRRRIILAVTIAAALFGVVAASALAQNSESAPAAAALMKSKPKTRAGGSILRVELSKKRPAPLRAGTKETRPRAIDQSGASAASSCLASGIPTLTSVVRITSIFCRSGLSVDNA